MNGEFGAVDGVNRAYTAAVVGRAIAHLPFLFSASNIGRRSGAEGDRGARAFLSAARLWSGHMVSTWLYGRYVRDHHAVYRCTSYVYGVCKR